MKKMMILKMEELFFFVKNNHDIILAVLLSGLITRLLTTKLRKSSDAIPGRLGLPLVGETFSFLSATNSDKGCYDFVRAKTILTNDFQLFNKGYVKSMADAVGKNSLLCVPVESHKRIRRLLSAPFSMDSLSKFVQKFDKLVSERFEKLAENGNSFVVLDFTMKSMLERDLFAADEKLDDSEIMDNMLTLIIAGQTTTAAAIMWSEEQLSILRNKPEGAFLCKEDLNKMSYGSKVVKETLRMSNEIQKPYNYIPFGSGPRTCLGINMAKVTIWTVDDQDLSLEKKSHIPRLKSGVPITLTSLKDYQI
ncbi:cytochrome P450 [Cynara cardunculus var. scolymus]|uniref:Cytochrome P450 n=1 Tax=Cynara cardunculus var. scolymus TaxID=59895 RepID=A0A103Y5D3_CYNCS|nr:cytochrome P450 [Cynara cardunculus var. scolymus]